MSRSRSTMRIGIFFSFAFLVLGGWEGGGEGSACIIIAVFFFLNRLTD